VTQKGDLPLFTAVLFGDGFEQPREQVGLFTAFTKIFTQKSKSLILITSELKKLGYQSQTSTYNTELQRFLVFYESA
jgi:hypothetical protein